MRARTRVLTLVIGLLAIFTTSVGAAQAWSNTGDTRFTATGGAFTLSTATGTLTCVGETATGTAGTSSGSPTWAGAMTFTDTWSPCVVSGIRLTVVCPLTFDGLSWNSGTNVVTGNLNITTPGCSVRNAGGGEMCRITGSMGSTYADPRTGTAGIIRFPTGSSNIIVVNGGLACPLGDHIGGTLSPNTKTVTSGTGGPNIRQP